MEETSDNSTMYLNLNLNLKLNLNSKRLEETSDKKMSYYEIDLDAGPFFLVISFF